MATPRSRPSSSIRARISPRAHEHEGEELLYVLAGSVELAFAGRSLILGQGGAVEFAGHLPHRLRRIGAAASAVLIVVARG
ncbi:hypothetical protein GCM10011504_33070 [Siccirubricoccus deserti]|uniref:Cupin domain-containing protein n=1 Tax=Siccirubricoccus deserti TaxID=2013562 RepID=A0A9X0UI30_9PROT|nr:cupin domain-containing protein [Siccirubricoccus deserti]MBC4016705.1 cupin domain-containing protein [Siccirubricoccus deserti]GGC52017.1 hypothetical protein GCM10011504_33070 [Siccirubricoccus deserti]